MSDINNKQVDALMQELLRHLDAVCDQGHQVIIKDESDEQVRKVRLSWGDNPVQERVIEGLSKYIICAHPWYACAKGEVKDYEPMIVSAGFRFRPAWSASAGSGS